MKIQEIIDSLKEEAERGTPIVVEGVKDFRSLRRLGIEGKLITAKTGGKTRLDAMRQIEKTAPAREVILLLDFDRRGKEWTRLMKQRFEVSGIKVNVTFWRRLLGLAGRDLKDIEGLASYLDTLKRKSGESGFELEAALDM